MLCFIIIEIRIVIGIFIFIIVFMYSYVCFVYVWVFLRNMIVVNMESLEVGFIGKIKKKELFIGYIG